MRKPCTWLLLLCAGFGQAAAGAPLAVFDAAVAAMPVPPSSTSWRPEVAAVRHDLGAQPTLEHVYLAIQTLLARRRDSGFGQGQLYTSDDQDYWTVTACFSPQWDSVKLRHIGAWFARHGKRWYVRDVLPDGPAARAGLIRGDEIIDVDGSELRPVGSFARLGPADKAWVQYRRMAWDKPRRVAVETVTANLATSLLKSVQGGYYARKVGNRARIAYVKLPLSCHPSFETALLTTAKWAQMEADAMVLDLRGDFGPGGLTYLAPFFALPVPGERATAPSGIAPFAKPLVVLVDAGTSGGREELAAFLQQHQRAILVGAPTAGARAPGRASELEPGTSLLWLTMPGGAVSKPLVPDVPAEAALVYAAGADPQLDLALQAAAMTK